MNWAYLSDNKLDEVPLVKDNALVGFLNYKSISSELYKQAEEKLIYPIYMQW